MIKVIHKYHFHNGWRSKSAVAANRGNQDASSFRNSRKNESTGCSARPPIDLNWDSTPSATTEVYKELKAAVTN